MSPHHAASPFLACSFIYWAEYMATNVVGVDVGGETRPDTVAEETPAAVMATTSGSGMATAAPETEDDDEVLLPRKNLDRLTDTSSLARFFGGTTLPIRPGLGPQTEWDLRAGMEKRRRMERERARWLAENERRIGRYSSVASDWRTDVRITDTGDPTKPTYREWTLREIWDMITLGGKSIDPRDVPHRISELGSRTDFVAEGFVQQMDIPEWLAAEGRLIEDDEDEVVDRDAELALLASEFSDFDDFGAVGDPLSDSLDDGFSGDF